MKKLIKLLCMVTVITLATSLCGCSDKNISAEEGTQVVNNLFASLQSLNFEEAKQYIDVTKIEDYIDEELGTSSNQFMNEWFDSISCEVVSSEIISDDEIEVYTKITVRDMRELFQKQNEKLNSYYDVYINENLSVLQTLSQSDLQKRIKEMIQAKTREFFYECLRNDDYNKITTSVTLKVINDNGNLQVEIDEEFLNAILGDWQGAINTYMEQNNITVTQ